jgi:hypothetical protein
MPGAQQATSMAFVWCRSFGATAGAIDGTEAPPKISRRLMRIIMAGHLLEGEAFQEGQRLLPDWAAVAATDTIDENFHSPSGCVLLTVLAE